MLNEYFHNVCELDLVFNFYKVRTSDRVVSASSLHEIGTWFKSQVYQVVDEMFLAGEVRETSQTKVMKQMSMLASLE